MTGKITSLKMAGTTAVFLILGALPSQSAYAGAEAAELPGVAYSVNSSMADNLGSLLGKKVRVSLANGTSLTGTVKAVSNELLHLEKLEGKEFFDALVRIAEIGAIDTRFRDYQR